MAIRPIDGNELYGIVKLMDTYVIKQSKTASFLLEQVLHDIQAMPTLPGEGRASKMNKEQRQAYEWAKNQNYQSVAARYAKILTGLIDGGDEG